MEKKYWSWSMERPPGHLKVGLILKNASIAYPDKGIIDANTDKMCTYRELNERVNRAANGLLHRGCKPGDFLAGVTRMGPEAIELYFICAKAGLIYIPLPYRFAPKEMENLMRFTGTKTLIFDSRYKKLTDQIDLKVDRYLMGEESGGLTPYAELLENEPTEPDIEIKDDTPLLVGFTSGTTGSPKVYLRSNYANFLNHACYPLSYDFNYQDVTFNLFPPSMTAFTWVCGTMLAKGTSVVMDFDPKIAADAVRKYKVTIMYGVPAMYKTMIDLPDIDKYDFSSLRAIGSVGSVMPTSTLERIWEKITPNVYDHIGLQETGFIAVNRPDMKRKKPTSVGPPCPFHEITIVDKDGKEAGTNEIGEILISYPDGAGEYYKNEEKTKEAFKDGLFHTGDLGKLDEDGYLYVVGRTKDMIVTGGYNVYASDVEDAIMYNSKIEDCAVVGIPDKQWGEKLVAVVALKKGESTTEEELIEFCKENMAHYKAPKSVYFTDVIPRTATGKVQKFKLVDRYKDEGD